MSFESDVKSLMKIDEIIKQGLEDEVQAMKNLILEITGGLQELKNTISQTKFENLKTEDNEEILRPATEAIVSFISELSPLDELDNRFAKIKDHSQFLIKTLTQFKNTLGVYGSTEKAITDFENNIIYGFKTTVLRNFEQDIEFNKRVEESLD